MARVQGMNTAALLSVGAARKKSLNVLIAGFSTKATGRFSRLFKGHHMHFVRPISVVKHQLGAKFFEIVVVNADSYGNDDIVALSSTQPQARIIAVHGDKSGQRRSPQQGIVVTPREKAGEHIQNAIKGICGESAN